MKQTITYQVRFKTKSKLLEATIVATIISDDQARAVKLATNVMDNFIKQKAAEGVHIVYKLDRVTRVNCDFFLIDDKKVILNK